MEIKKMLASLKKAGYSLYRIANELELSYQTVFYWNAGKSNPRYDKLQLIEGLYNKVKGVK